MNTSFVTGNTGKFRELSELIPNLTQVKLELDEIQGLKPEAVLAHKLTQASHHQAGPILVDDTSLTFACLGGNLPGPLIKWFLQELTPAGLAELAIRSGEVQATARATLGYRDAQGEHHYFTGAVSGKVVPPIGESGFGWDSIFLPDGHTLTFAQMGQAKNQISHRFLAAQAFKDFLGAQT